MDDRTPTYLYIIEKGRLARWMMLWDVIYIWLVVEMHTWSVVRKSQDNGQTKISIGAPPHI